MFCSWFGKIMLLKYLFLVHLYCFLTLPKEDIINAACSPELMKCDVDKIYGCISM